MNISTGFIPPINCKPPQYKNILALKEFQGNIFTKTHIRGAISNSGKHYLKHAQ